MHRLPASFLIICLVVVVCAAPCQAGVNDISKPESQFRFAEELLEDHDYYRAITEYKRFIFFFPNHELCEKAFFRIGESYNRAGRFEESIQALKEFIGKFPHSHMKNDALYLKGAGEKELKKYDDALDSLGKVIDSTSGEFRNKAIYQSALVLVDMESWKRAGGMFLRIPQQSMLRNSADIFSAGLERIDGIPQKSPVLAGTFAALVPGAGHLYTERRRDALVAFLLNGAFIWAAVELYNDEKYVTGSIVTFFELGWYSGNIYSAVSSAHKYNEQTKYEFIEGLKKRTSLSYFYDDKASRNVLMLSMKF